MYTKIFSNLNKRSIVYFLIFCLFFTVITPYPLLAAKLSNAKVTLSNPVAGSSSSYAFQFTVPSGAPIREIRFQWSTTTDNQSIPTSGMLSGAAKGTLVNLNTNDWSLETSLASTGLLELQHTSSVDLNGLVVGITIDSITNSSITACDPEESSDSCFIQVRTSSGTGNWNDQVIDSTTVIYTVIQGVTVSATIDPIFTFVIGSVGANTVIGGATTTVASTPSSLPFGNLTSGSPKYMAHQLNVTTNSNSGYVVTMRASQAMTGSYTANNIDPFSAPGVSWSNPQSWTTPTGQTPSENTGWLGAHTTDPSVSQFDDGEFGPVNGTDNIVMSSTTPDDGLTAVYVNYGIEVNVFQPSDIYSGYILYTATPTY